MLNFEIQLLVQLIVNDYEHLEDNLYDEGCSSSYKAVSQTW